MSVSKGFKQTEVGMIPEDWEIEAISEIASVKTGPFGSLLHEKDYVSSGTPIITVEHLGEYGITSKDIPNVSDIDKLRLKEYILRKHDIVFSRVGSIDRSALVSDHETGWLFSGRLLRVRGTSRLANPIYLNYCFKSESFKKKIYSVAVGQTMASLNTKILKSVKVSLPPPVEQTAIAAALSDMDALIEGVEKLLEKKRCIKQGAMQELLTGKRRVSGFESQAGFQQTEVGVIPKDWRVKKLSDLSSMKSGKAITSKNIHDTDIYPCLGGNGLRGYTSSYTHDGNFALIGRQGALCGNVQFISGKFFASEHAVVVTSKEQIDIKLLYYMLLDMNLHQYAESSAQPGLSVAKINELPIALPSSRAEQTAIAAILSDMDSEIEQLEKQLAKYRQLKTGMMQELLTGKKRLV